MSVSKNYKGTTLTYVVNKKGKPLMPTRNTRRVKELLLSKKAIVICNNPFTIRLKYDTPDKTQPMHLGIDTGRENLGISVTTESGQAVYFEELQTNNKQIKQSLTSRKQYRNIRHRNKRIKNQRRALRNNNQIKDGESTELRHKQRSTFKSKKMQYPGMEKSVEHKIIKGAEARFNNRKRPEGWLTPSGRQLIKLHLNVIKRVSRYLPITDIHIERVSFDFQKLENEDIQNWQYSKGPLYGYNTLKDYINEQQRGRCLLCGEKGINHYHHIVNKSKGGSNTPENIAGLCLNCHNKVHKIQSLADRLSELKEGTKIKYSISLLNSVMPKLIEEVTEYCNQNNLNMHITNGYETSKSRAKLGVNKKHYFDAYIISLSDRIQTIDKAKTITVTLYESRRFKKKSKNIIHQYGDRIYYRKEDEDNTNPLAYNRHKKTGQLRDSLEELINREGEWLYTKLKAKPCKHTTTALIENPRLKPSFHAGDIVEYVKVTKSGRITSRGVYVVSSVKNSENQLELTMNNKVKTVNMNFCRRLQSQGCIPIIQSIRMIKRTNTQPKASV